MCVKWWKEKEREERGKKRNIKKFILFAKIKMFLNKKEDLDFLFSKENIIAYCCYFGDQNFHQQFCLNHKRFWCQNLSMKKIQIHRKIEVKTE
jgi:hypothetical protein